MENNTATLKTGDRVVMIDCRSAIGTVDACPVKTPLGMVHVTFDSGCQAWFPPAELEREVAELDIPAEWRIIPQGAQLKTEFTTEESDATELDRR